MQRTVLALSLTIAFTNPFVNAIVLAKVRAQPIRAFLPEVRGAHSGDLCTAADAYRKATGLEISSGRALDLCSAQKVCSTEDSKPSRVAKASGR